MHLRRHILGALLAVAVASSAHAQALDAPSLSLTHASRTSIALDVIAGASGAPAGFTVEWMSAATHDQLGAWPADVNDPRIARGVFSGVPTLNIHDGTRSFVLMPVADAGIEIGDLFDETGFYIAPTSELQGGVEYVVRVKALASATQAASPYSATLRVTTLSPQIQNCTYTQGYWKNHPAAWPVGSLTLGNVNYSAAQLMSIFNKPAQGNGLVSLAHQLIAAKLNIAQGAVAPAAVAAAIASADALIANLIVPPVGAGYIKPGTTSGLTNTLDQFNNGVTGPGHCGSTPVKASTWGGLKSLYR